MGSSLQLSIGFSNEDLLKIFSVDDGSLKTLSERMTHYFGHSLRRDGFAGVRCRVFPEAPSSLEFELPLNMPQQVDDLPKMFDDNHALIRRLGSWRDALCATLENARIALENVFPVIRGRPAPRLRPEPPRPWDPDAAYPEVTKWDKSLAWQPFFGHGLPLIGQRCVQFFHYPPLRLLTKYQDYLNDPVPMKVELLLLANRGWDQLLFFGSRLPLDREVSHVLAIYERVVDGCPIAAPDNQGSGIIPDLDGNPILIKTDSSGKPVYLKGRMPMEDFGDYQRSELRLHLLDNEKNSRFTIPLVVYGGPAQTQMKTLFNAPVVHDDELPFAGVVTINEGKTTPFVTAQHPYHFFWWAQGEDESLLGKGQLQIRTRKKMARLEELMRNDLAVAGWTFDMIDDPTRDPKQALKARQDFWHKPENLPHVQALILFLSSYKEGEDKVSYEFLNNIRESEIYVREHPERPYGIDLE